MPDDTPEIAPRPARRQVVSAYVRHWLPSAVALVILLGVVLVTAHYTERRREYVECHTEAMDALHVALYSHLAMDPKRPEIWAEGWALAFEAWQARMEGCPHVE